MNRYEYKNYWIEIFIEGDELKDCEAPLYFVPYIEFPDQGGVVTTGDSYVTSQEARNGAQKFIDMLDSYKEDEIHWLESVPENE